jgi:formylglycine-generating enzyme required for sulfatase activity
MSITPNPLTSIADLAREIIPALIAAGPRSLRASLAEAPTTQALSRCLTPALLALITPAPPESLASLRPFLTDPDVVKELAQPLSGLFPKADELTAIYTETIDQLPAAPGLNFDHGVLAYAAAFNSALRHEPVLHSLPSLVQEQAALRAKIQLPDTVQQRLDAATAQMMALLSSPNANSLTANDIHAHNVVVGVQHVVHQHFYAQRIPKWEEHYLRTLIARCDPLDLLPLSETQTDEQGRPLQGVGISDVFAMLNLAVLQKNAGDDLNKIAGYIASLNKPLPTPDRRNDVIIPIQAIEAVAATARLVILGQPGGGKSSLVNHLAVQLARRRLGQAASDERLPNWGAELRPILIKIVVRELAEWLSADAARTDVWRYIAKLLEQWGCSECFAELKIHIVNEGGLILFDGLDEVRAAANEDDPLRARLKTAILNFAAPLPSSKVVLTCREYAYQPPAQNQPHKDWRLPIKDFPVVTLAPLTPGQIDQFVHDWYRVTGPLPPRFWDEVRCATEAHNLAQAIRDETRPYLLDLAKNPLLLTLMAQVHGSYGELPNDRADLYERAVKLLLNRWEARLERDPSGGRAVIPGIYQQLGISPEGLSIALQEAAFVAHSQQVNEADVQAHRRAANIAEPLLLQQLKRHFDNDYGKAQLALGFVQKRAGLLLAHTDETYSFPHRTFQEYLAARHIMRLGDPANELRSLLNQNLEWWREVFLLAAGTQRKQPKLIRDLAEAVLVTIPSDEVQSKTLIADLHKLLAVEQALHETRFADEVAREPRTAQPGPFAKLHAEAQQALLRAMRSPLGLTAAERAQAGNALARLGDPRFDAARLYLPAEADLGFIHIPADPHFKMGARQKDFERVMQVIKVEKESQKDWRDETNDAPTPTQAFYIARYPVTTAQWRAYVEDKRRRDPTFTVGDEDSLRGTANHPAIYASWHEAMAYCAWLTEQIKTLKVFQTFRVCELLRSGQWHITLPSELEWEVAARGGNDSIFGFGDAPDAQKANFDESRIGGTSAVGCFAPNAFGCVDMIGNVWEWTRSKYAPYPYHSDDGRESLNGDDQRVLRGGSWVDGHRDARVACRGRYSPVNRNSLSGFRVVCAPVLSPVASGPL